MPDKLMREPSPTGIGGAACDGDGAAIPLDFAAARTSLSVTRPSGPVPLTAERSTPCSAARRRAIGDALTRASPLLSFGAVAEDLGDGGAAFFSVDFDLASSCAG